MFYLCTWIGCFIATCSVLVAQVPHEFQEIDQALRSDPRTKTFHACTEKLSTLYAQSDASVMNRAVARFLCFGALDQDVFESYTQKQPVLNQPNQHLIPQNLQNKRHSVSNEHANHQDMCDVAQLFMNAKKWSISAALQKENSLFYAITHIYRSLKKDQNLLKTHIEGLLNLAAFVEKFFIDQEMAQDVCARAKNIRCDHPEYNFFYDDTFRLALMKNLQNMLKPYQNKPKNCVQVSSNAESISKLGDFFVHPKPFEAIAVFLKGEGLGYTPSPVHYAKLLQDHYKAIGFENIIDCLKNFYMTGPFLYRPTITEGPVNINPAQAQVNNLMPFFLMYGPVTVTFSSKELSCSVTSFPKNLFTQFPF